MPCTLLFPTWYPGEIAQTQSQHTVPKAYKSLQKKDSPSNILIFPFVCKSAFKRKKWHQEEPGLQAHIRRACKEGSVLLELSVTVISSAEESRTRKPPARKAVKEKQMASWCTQSWTCSQGMNSVPSLPDFSPLWTAPTTSPDTEARWTACHSRDQTGSHHGSHQIASHSVI